MSAPEDYAAKTWTREEALREIVRGRLEGLGPVTARTLAEQIGVPCSTSISRSWRWRRKDLPCAAATPPAPSATEWCERRLLARINRYTVKRLRNEIEPVGAARLHALSARLAAHRAGRAHGRSRMRSRRSSRSWRASKRPRRRGKPRSCPRASPATSRPGSTTCAWPVAWSGRGWRRRRIERRPHAGPQPGAQHAGHADHAQEPAGVGGAGETLQRRGSAAELAGAGGGGFPGAARRLLLRRYRARASTCRAPSSRKRWASWSRSGW